MKYLILFLVSFSVSANYVKTSDLDSGSITKVFTRMSGCGSDCIKIPTGFNKETHKKEEILKPNYSSPIVSKSEAESCVAVSDDPLTLEIDEAKTLEEDCQSKLEAKSCMDSEEYAVKVMDAGAEEVYCTKTTYPMIGSGKYRVVEDPALKATWKAADDLKRSTRKAKRDEARVTLKGKLKAGTNLTPEELRKALIYLLGD